MSDTLDFPLAPDTIQKIYNVTCLPAIAKDLFLEKSLDMMPEYFKS